jgi:hypothetical protein
MTNLTDVLAALTEILQPLELRIYDEPPESINEFPCLFCYVGGGQMSQVEATWAEGTHSITVEILLARYILPIAVYRAKQYPSQIFALLSQNQTLNSTVHHIIYPIRYETLPLEYSDGDYYGIRFSVEIYIKDENEAGL